jgi:hypothetical protein
MRPGEAGGTASGPARSRPAESRESGAARTTAVQLSVMLAGCKTEMHRGIPSGSLLRRSESCRNRLLTIRNGRRSMARNPSRARLLGVRTLSPRRLARRGTRAFPSCRQGGHASTKPARPERSRTGRSDRPATEKRLSQERSGGIREFREGMSSRTTQGPCSISVWRTPLTLRNRA